MGHFRASVLHILALGPLHCAAPENALVLRLVSFTQAIVCFLPGTPRLIKWDHSVLLRHWGAVSIYTHWAGAPGETSDSAQWFVRGLGIIEGAATYLWQSMQSGYSGIMMPDHMQPEIRQAWDDFRSGTIDLEGVRNRAHLALPMLSVR